MLEIVLYRKYRPNSFKQIIGQSSIVNALQNSLKNNNIFHSYIFSGSRGSGKTSMARIFAKSINCLNSDNDCCNECKNCQLINEGSTFDIYEIDAASNSGVDEIRKLIEVIDYLPSQLNKKIYIIDEAHMLSTSAWNALLKTIEEPPKHVYFIFATTEINKIPLTIISRCQRFNFLKLQIKELLQLIEYISEKEGILIANDVKNKIAILSDGSARDCLSILQQLSIFTNKKITLEAINELFGLVDLDTKIDFINNCFNKSIFDRLNEFNKLSINYLNLAKDLSDILLDKIVYLKTNNINLLKILTISDLHKIKFDIDQCFQLLEIFNEIYEKIKLFDNGIYYFESLLVRNISLNNFSNNNIEDSVDTDSKTEIIKQDYKECFELKNVTNEYNSCDKKDHNFLPTNIDLQNWFNQINANSNKSNTSYLIEKLENLKIENNVEIQPLLVCNKILVSSEYGALILFNFQSDVDKFLKWFYLDDGYRNVWKLFGKEFLIVPFIKQQIQQLKQNYDDKIKYQEIDLKAIWKNSLISNDEKIKEIFKITNDME